MAAIPKLISGLKGIRGYMGSNSLASDRPVDQDKEGYQESPGSLGTMGVCPKLEHDQECTSNVGKAPKLTPQGSVYKRSHVQAARASAPA